MSRPTNFGDLPPQFNDPRDASIVIIPVAYDRTNTWLKGADAGPEAIIEASANMELYDIETDSEVYQKGIYTDNIIKGLSLPEDVIDSVAKRTMQWLKKNKFVVVIGGVHTVSIGSITAHAQSFKGLAVLQLDAHADLRDEYNGSKYNHACVMARVKELCPIVQVGIRSMDVCEKKSLNRESTFFAEDICNKKDWIGKLVSLLPDRVYITIDLDVFDPSIMPSTGTPEPGGLLWYDVLELLKHVCEKKDVVGFDVVELCPDAHNKAPDFLAAKLIYKVLSYKFRG